MNARLPERCRPLVPSCAGMPRASAAPGSGGISSADGTALVIVLGAMLVLSAMGLALVLLSMSHAIVARNELRARTALYAAEAGLERALPDLVRLPDWDAVLDGRARSAFVDGPSAGARVLPDGSRISLDEIVSLANCGTAAACTEARMDAVTAERPWGPNNPRWRLFGHGPLSELPSSSGLLPPAEYVVVLVADDPSELDGNPLRDGRPGVSAGAGVLLVRAEAFGPESAHRAVEAVVARGTQRPDTGGYAGQRGEGATGGLGAGSDVQMPGGALTRSEMTLSGGLIRQ
jgi:hypothetical protein